MYKNSIIILFLLFSFQAINAQKIFYSEKLNDRFDFNRSYVVGKVKNNIVVLKYGEAFKKPELLIYDYNMHLKGTVPFDIINSGVLARVNFVNRGDVFDAIVQYYTANNFYCKIARFNDEGQLVNAIQTVDSIRTKKQNDAEIYHIVKSENNEQVILMRAVTAIKPNCLQLEYKFINSKLKIDQEKKYVIPFSEDTRLSPFYINNSGDLMFCEFVPNSNNQNAILFYKILKSGDTAINSVEFIGTNRPMEMAITIDNDKKEYLINGLFYETPDEDLITGTFAQSIYSGLFNDDLVIKGKDTTIEIQQLNGLESRVLNNMLLVNSGNSKNNGYYVTCAGMKSAGYQEYWMHEPPNYADIVSASELLSHPYNDESMRVNSNTLGQPTSPIYYNSDEIYRRNIDNAGFSTVNRMQPNYKGLKNLSLITMYITSENKLGWVRILDDSIGNNFVTHISPGITTQNLHFIFSEQIGKNKKTISELVVSKTGEHYIKGIVLNNLYYDIQLEKGVQVDNRSMIFPCNVKEKLGFVRIEFD